VRKIDLDTVPFEPYEVSVRGAVLKVEEPTVEQHIQHARLVAELEDATEKLKALVDKGDTKGIEKQRKELRDVVDSFDYRMLSLFVPDLKQDTYKALTLSQKDKLLGLIFEREDGSKNDETPSEG